MIHNYSLFTRAKQNSKNVWKVKNKNIISESI